MAIQAKPFSSAQKLAKRIFKPNPSVFTSEDLNQSIDIHYEHLKIASRNLGLIRDNWKINMRLIRDEVVGGSNRFVSEINIIKVVDALPAHVFSNGIAFELPTGDTISYVGDWTTVQFPIGYVVLIAKKALVTFATDTSIAGVQDDTYPNVLPSSDAYQYSGERVVYVKDVSDVGGVDFPLSAGEEVIGIIASVIPTDDNDVAVTTSVPAGGSLPVVNINYSEAIRRVVMYNAISHDDLSAAFGLEFGDNILNILGVTSKTQTDISTNNNSGINDFIAAFTNNYAKHKKYVNLGFKSMRGIIDRTLTVFGNLSATIATIQENIEALFRRQEIPIGAIIEWGGDLSLFDANGKGKPDTVVSKFHICNGLGGTVDRRGRFPVMAILGVPATGAPSLASAVDPLHSDTNYPQYTNPMYAVNSVGGAGAGLVLKTENLPKMKAKIKLLKSSFTDWNRSSGSGTPLVGIGDKAGVEGTDWASSSAASVAITGHASTEEFGGDKVISVIPPYVGVVYIQRVI